MITQKHRNVHVVSIKSKEYKVAWMSDIHWDNPHCDRAMLKKHLDKCLAEDRKVIINGDMFCLMQGKYDPRRSKKDIRPEHNVPNYLDAVIQTAVEWFAPYKDILLLIGYGNHETAIIKNVETDPLQRFVDLFNYTHKANLQIGGYGGWIVFRMIPFNGNRQAVCKAYYFHGNGGGGAVTKDVIQNQRQMADIEGADIITMGHVHELYHLMWSKKYLDKNHKPMIRDVHHLRTGTYKDEYNDGYMGWHVERGAPPKPLGCIATDMHFERDTNQVDNVILVASIWNA